MELARRLEREAGLRYANAVHFTNGGPWFKDWQNVDYGEQWTAKALAIDPDFKPI